MISANFLHAILLAVNDESGIVWGRFDRSMDITWC